MLNIQTQLRFKYAHQQILFFKLLSNVKLIYSTRALALGAIGHFFFFSGGAEEGAQWGKKTHQSMVLKNALTSFDGIGCTHHQCSHVSLFFHEKRFLLRVQISHIL
jgi:hypothetical protein